MKLGLNEHCEVMVPASAYWQGTQFHMQQGEAYHFLSMISLKPFMDSTLVAQSPNGFNSEELPFGIRYYMKMFEKGRRNPREPWLMLMGCINKQDRESAFAIGIEKM